ncbi:MAG TPA: (d)CMP kinase [Acidimicrobiales bacterium]|nr:(d)CMP kinase [Acidimicrobiales bacterium]
MQLIAIDGPGGSGKSTVSKALAGKLGLQRLDTGAMYRAVALLAVRMEVDLHDGELLGQIAREMQLEMDETVILDGEDVSREIRSEAVDSSVSLVARQPEVRTELVRRQREWATKHAGGVIEGRDIGSVVFPAATLKVYLTASASERARRRALQSAAMANVDSTVIQATGRSIARRDEIDSTRDTSPLLVADGAIVIDSTRYTPDEVVDQIVAML